MPNEHLNKTDSLNTTESEKPSVPDVLVHRLLEMNGKCPQAEIGINIGLSNQLLHLGEENPSYLTSVIKSGLSSDQLDHVAARRERYHAHHNIGRGKRNHDTGRSRNSGKNKSLKNLWLGARYGSVQTIATFVSWIDPDNSPRDVLYPADNYSMKDVALGFMRKLRMDFKDDGSVYKGDLLKVSDQLFATFQSAQVSSLLVAFRKSYSQQPTVGEVDYMKAVRKLQKERQSKLDNIVNILTDEVITLPEIQVDRDQVHINLSRMAWVR